VSQLWCPQGKHEVKFRSTGPAGERWCPEHGCELGKLPASRQPKHKQGLPGEKAAKARFRQVVCSHPCFFLDIEESGERRRPGHTCRYPLDAHHIIPQSWIKQTYRGHLPDAELVALMHNPILGAPLCRKAHDAVEYSPSEYIYRDELEPDLIAFCERFDVEHPGLSSLLGRLYVECPERPVDEAVAA
jgi:hypothetical protein